MKNKQKGFGPIPLIIAIGAVVILIIFFLSARKNGLPSENIGIQQTTQSAPAIQSTNDLNNVDSELDNTNLGEFDSELNQLDADVSAF